MVFIMNNLNSIINEYIDIFTDFWNSKLKYISLNNIKNIILKSTNKKLKFLHILHGKYFNKYNNLNLKIHDKLNENYKYMFSCHETSTLKKN
jgi:hypothetical protein